MADDPGRGDNGDCCILIPARFASTRFPAKPLALLVGADGVGRPLIEWSWRAARQAADRDGRVRFVAVATDDDRIADAVRDFGGEVVMTPPECANGTERCAAAIAALPEAPDIVVNFQGDAPPTPCDIVTAVIGRMRDEPGLPVATPAIRSEGDTYRHLIEDRAAGRVGGTTMVVNAARQAMYFSKNVIPYRPESGPGSDVPVHLHLGIYAYRRAALLAYAAAPASSLEVAEGLEQLRFLDMGMAVGAVLCAPPEGTTIELNNPTDVPLIERELQRRGL